MAVVPPLTVPRLLQPLCFCSLTETSLNKHRFPSILRVRPKSSLFTSRTTNKESLILSNSLSPKFSLLQEVERLCQIGHLTEASVLLQRDLINGNSTSLHVKEAICMLLQACTNRKDIETGMKLHRIVSDSAQFSDDLVLNTRLITMYSACGSPFDSRFVFDGLAEKNLIQWNALVSGYTKNEFFSDALNLFVELISVTGFKPDNFTFPCVIKASAGFLDVGLGKVLHGMAVKMGLIWDVFVGNALIAMYGKCGSVEGAVKVFDYMPERNLISWNSLICMLSENGYTRESLFLLIEMLVSQDSLVPDVATVVTVLPACAGEGEVDLGMGVHALAVKLGLSQELTVSNALIDMYSKCGHLPEAQILFDKNDNRSVVSWNSIMGGFSLEGDINETLNLLRNMQTEAKEMKANKVTILNVLPICLKKSQLLSLKELNGYSFRHHLQHDELVANAFIAAYAKCGSLSSAEKVFNNMETKTVSSWNAIIGGYAQNGDPKSALYFYFKMTNSGLEPDWFTTTSLLVACTHLNLLHYGKQIHGFSVRRGLESDLHIKTSLISFYNNCGKSSAAYMLFDGTKDKGIVSWNVMISGHSQNGLLNESLILFRHMLSDGIQPDEFSMLSVFGTCSQLPALQLGKEAHGYALKALLTEDIYVGCSIIDMYAKCGCVEQSRRVFDCFKDKNVVSWNAIIAGYGIHGRGKEAIQLFEEMKKFGLEPDKLTFISILMACTHAGLIEEGLTYFSQMKKLHKIEPNLEHHACVADMLSRAGRLDDALRIVCDMPEEPDARIWTSLLRSCITHGALEMGESVAEKLLQMQPDRAENYVLLSNLYAGAGKWDDMKRVKQYVKGIGLQKDIGRSWIELGGKMHKFAVGDAPLPNADENCDT